MRRSTPHIIIATAMLIGIAVILPAAISIINSNAVRLSSPRMFPQAHGVSAGGDGFESPRGVAARRRLLEGGR